MSEEEYEELKEDLINGEREFSGLTEEEHALLIRYGSTDPDPRLMDDFQLDQATTDADLDKFTRDKALHEQGMRDLERDPTRPEY